LQLQQKKFVEIHNNHLNNIGMYLSKEGKEDLFEKHGKSKNDTGSTEGQVALFTHRINILTQSAP
jgi:small subunit ribosomal protein S15